MRHALGARLASESRLKERRVVVVGFQTRHNFLNCHVELIRIVDRLESLLFKTRGTPVQELRSSVAAVDQGRGVSRPVPPFDAQGVLMFFEFIAQALIILPRKPPPEDPEELLREYNSLVSKIERKTGLPDGKLGRVSEKRNNERSKTY